jgi:hypothetical protein
MRMKAIFTAVVFAAISLPVVAQMGDMPAAPAKPAAKPVLSPPAVATATLGSTAITINYSSPRMRGRKIIGGLVPYGQVWRTGANAATTLKTTGELKIGTLTVPAGTYTLYSLPTENLWTLIVNKQTGQWGTVYDEKQDLGRVQLTAASGTMGLENFLIEIQPKGGNKGELHLRWENTDVFVPILAK